MPAGRKRQPIELIEAKGKKHLTKSEIEQRKKEEIKVNAIDVQPPKYLTGKQKKDFMKYAKILLDIGIMTELDEDRLAQYLISMDEYIEYTKKIKRLKRELKNETNPNAIQRNIETTDLYLRYQNRALKQSRDCASDLGLSISSRCRLIMPEINEPPKENKFNKFRKIE